MKYFWYSGIVIAHTMIVPLLVSAAPFPVSGGVATAQRAGSSGGLQSIFDKLREGMERIIPVLIGVALFGFVIGVMRYVMHGDSSNKRDQAIQLIIYTLTALLVMTAVWGFVAMLHSLLFSIGNPNANIGGEPLPLHIQEQRGFIDRAFDGIFDNFLVMIF